MITVFKDVITLITVERVSDGAGGYENKPGTKRTVFANKKSATRSEFYLAQQADLEVEVVFTIYTSEYNDEQVMSTITNIILLSEHLKKAILWNSPVKSESVV